MKKFATLFGAALMAGSALCAAQAIDLLAPLKPGAGTGKGYDVVRGFTPRLDRDRYLAPEIEASARAVKAGQFATIVRDQGGE